MISKHKHIPRFLLGVLAVAILVVISYWLYQHMGQESQLKLFIVRYGYIAALVLGFVGGFHFILPFPSLIFIPVFIQAGLSFWLVALLLAIGMTAAYCVEYLLAKEGWQQMHGALIKRWTQKLHRWHRHHHLLPLGGLLFYTSFVPAPNELSLPVFAALGYRALSVMLVIFSGNLIYCLAYGSGLVEIFRR